MALPAAACTVQTMVRSSGDEQLSRLASPGCTQQHTCNGQESAGAPERRGPIGVQALQGGARAEHGLQVGILQTRVCAHVDLLQQAAGLAGCHGREQHPRTGSQGEVTQGREGPEACLRVMLQLGAAVADQGLQLRALQAPQAAQRPAARDGQAAQACSARAGELHQQAVSRLGTEQHTWQLSDDTEALVGQVRAARQVEALQASQAANGTQAGVRQVRAGPAEVQAAQLRQSAGQVDGEVRRLQGSQQPARVSQSQSAQCQHSEMHNDPCKHLHLHIWLLQALQTWHAALRSSGPSWPAIANSTASGSAHTSICSPVNEGQHRGPVLEATSGMNVALARASSIDRASLAHRQGMT